VTSGKDSHPSDNEEKGQTLVVRVEEGKIVEKKVVPKKLDTTLREVILGVLNEWNPETSDLLVIRHRQEFTVRLPLSKEQYLKYSKYNLRRVENMAVFEVPLYVISFENKNIDDKLQDTKVYIVAPYIDDFISDQIAKLGIDITTATEEEEEAEIEEE